MVVTSASACKHKHSHGCAARLDDIENRVMRAISIIKQSCVCVCVCVCACVCVCVCVCVCSAGTNAHVTSAKTTDYSPLLPPNIIAFQLLLSYSCCFRYTDNTAVFSIQITQLLFSAYRRHSCCFQHTDNTVAVSSIHYTCSQLL